jgi:methylenetetrahydrofolate dehydrogenase (NADP+)/methenyltetrahydrofolate cyclohydrolase
MAQHGKPSAVRPTDDPAVKAKLMSGRALAKRVRDGAAVKVEKIRSATGVTACLATVLVGTDPASVTYTRQKQKRCEQAGMKPRCIELPASTTTKELVKTVTELAADESVHGILVQHPVPKPIDRRAAFEAIPLHKDIDGVSSAALGRVILKMPAFVPCTPAGIMRLLTEYNVALDGAHAVVIGRSPILGRPMASMLINAHATVTLCHSRTRDLPDLIRRADVLIAALGRPRFVQGGWLKPGVVVIDAGYNEGSIGDVDFDTAIEPASLITPVPGGVGPMTIATLIDHVADAAAMQLRVEL